MDKKVDDSGLKIVAEKKMKTNDQIPAVLITPERIAIVRYFFKVLEKNAKDYDSATHDESTQEFQAYMVKDFVVCTSKANDLIYFLFSLLGLDKDAKDAHDALGWLQSSPGCYTMEPFDYMAERQIAVEDIISYLYDLLKSYKSSRFAGLPEEILLYQLLLFLDLDGTYKLILAIRGDKTIPDIIAKSPQIMDKEVDVPDEYNVDDEYKEQYKLQTQLIKFIKNNEPISQEIVDATIRYKKEYAELIQNHWELYTQARNADNDREMLKSLEHEIRFTVKQAMYGDNDNDNDNDAEAVDSDHVSGCDEEEEERWEYDTDCEVSDVEGDPETPLSGNDSDYDSTH